MADDLASLPNLGPKSAAVLRAAGIGSAGELRELGAAVAFLRVRQSGARPSKNLLWAVHGALKGKSWNRLTSGERASLEAELERLGG